MAAKTSDGGTLALIQIPLRSKIHISPSTMRLILQFHRFKTLISFSPQNHLPRRTLSTLNHHHRHLQPHSDAFNQTISSITSIYSHPFYPLLGLCKSPVSLRNLHASLIVHGLANDLLCETKLVSLYGSFGNLRSARLVFDRIESPDLYSFKVMIRWYFLNELHFETLMLYRCLRKCLRESDCVIFSIVLKACCEMRSLEEGRKLHCHIVKAGNPDSFVLTGLVDMYAKCGEIGCSHEIFDEIDERSVVCWTSLIAGYVQNDCPKEGFVLFNWMREGLVQGNEFTIGSLLTGCAKLGALHQGKWLHGYVIKNGVDLNYFLSTGILDMYVKCGSISDARSVFDGLSDPDLVSWTAMIVGYAQAGRGDESLKMFVDKKWIDVSPNFMTMASVLSTCALVENLVTGRSVHCLSIKFGLEESAVQNALVHMYSKCHVLEDARKLFNSIFDKDVIAWNSMISGYAQSADASSAFHLFHEMRSESHSPDAVTCVSVISACASVSALRSGCSLHSYFVKRGMSSVNPYVGTALLNFYAKCGETVSARQVFEEMGEKNAVTWSALICGYGMYGDAEESLSLFSDMLGDNVRPNEVIFTSVLSACSHTGRVGEGWRCFSSMCQEYNIVPSMKHYACMVDIFSRAGRLEEALDFIEKMPNRPDVTVFGAFLHGCSLHSRFDLGEISARRMLKLHPDEACYYVLVSKFYASNGRWNQADEVRNLITQRGLNKSPGWSSMEMEINKGISSS